MKFEYATAGTLPRDQRPGGPPPIKPKVKVLIVDDEISFTRLLKANLEEAGHYEVRTENKARLARRAAVEFRPDIVLLDVMMPDGSGGDVAAELERDPMLKDTPITFITAAVRRGEMGSSSSIGGRVFMAKPVKLGELMEHIEKRIAMKRAAKTSPGASTAHVDAHGRTWVLLPTLGKFIDHVSSR
jgi:two-component system OmpR family response regulator